MMDGTEQDMHMCLSCHTTIIGLMNYVQHKQTGCHPHKTSATLALNALSTVPQAAAAETIFDSEPAEAYTVATEVETDLPSATDSIAIATEIISKDHSTAAPTLETVTFEEATEGSTIELISQPVSEEISAIISQDDLPVQAPLEAEPDPPPPPPRSSPPPSTPPPPPPSPPPPPPPLEEKSEKTVVPDMTEEVPPEEVAPEEADQAAVSPDKENVQIPPIGTPTSPLKSGENFFFSLELQSKKEDGERNSSPVKTQKAIKGTLDKSSSNNHSDLPISNIFSSLDFSSDEDFYFSYPEFSSDSNDYTSDEDNAPPRTHTGGKWKPGEGPSSCKTFPHPGYTGGKWKPGETPLEVQLKSGAKVSENSETTGEVGAEEESGAPAGTDGTSETVQEDLKSGPKENHCSECDSHECKHVTNVSAEASELPTSKDVGDEGDATTKRHVKKRRKVLDEASTEPVHHCQVCDKSFFSKYVIGRHILTRYHQNRAKTHPDGFRMLEKYYRYVIRLCPFQCSICQFYFNREKDLLDHMNTEEHLSNCLALVGPMFCTVCNLKLTSNEEMLAHLMDEKTHRRSLERQKQLCIVKECRYQIQCPFCDIMLHSSVRLRRHIRYKHQNGKQIKSSPRRKGRFKPECPKCHAKCHSMSALEIHIRRRHTKEKPYPCTSCDKSFSDNYSLKMHMKTNKHQKKEVPEKVRKPRQKKKKFNPDLVPTDEVSMDGDEEPSTIKSIPIKSKLRINGESIRIVVKPNAKKKPFVKRSKAKQKVRIHKCEHCEFTAQSYGDLRPHYLDLHSEYVFLCNACDLVFLSEKALRVHHAGRMHQSNMLKSDESNLYTCEECGRKFHDERWCQFHVEMHHNHLNNEEAVRKMYQGKDVTSSKYLDYLAEIAQEPRDTTVQCPECSKNLKKEHVMEHLRMHTGEKPFVCRFCQNGFISSLSLRRHILRHLGLTERKCQICGKEFQKVFSYNVHMKQHENPDGAKLTHMCEVCGQSFSLKTQLVAHMRRHGQRAHKCPFPDCKWDFVFKSELTSHLRTHTGEKPFLCDICGYSGATRTRLARHARIHTGERTYHCDYCTYKAGNSTHLRRHMRIHIGSKPYKCPYCSYSCNTHENIRKHITKTKRHEGMCIYPCKFCPFGTNNTKDFRHHLLEAHTDQCDHKSLEVLSAFTGLYDKDVDPRKPPEGSQIIPIKERKQRTTKSLMQDPNSLLLTDEPDDEQMALAQEDEDVDKVTDATEVTVVQDTHLSMIAEAISESGVQSVEDAEQMETDSEQPDAHQDQLVQTAEATIHTIQNAQYRSDIIQHPQFRTDNLTSAHFQADASTLTTQAGDPNTANVLSIPENPAISSSLDLGYCTTIEYICLQTPNGT